jgi:very-short-patch-repair endonuclease
MPTPKNESPLERELAMQIRAFNLPEPICEYAFAPGRRFRFDFYWPSQLVAVECEGGHWAGGRHVRGAGFEKDCEKYNLAAELGIKVLRYTRKMIEDGSAVVQLERVLKNG